MTDLAAAIEQHGWLVVTGAGEAVSTAGLTAEGLPELAVVGLPPDVGGALLHELAERLLAGVPPDAEDELLEDLVQSGSALRLHDVPAPEGLPATEVYGDGVTLLQLLWADEDGRFPGDPAFAHADLQPLLGGAADALPDWTLPDDPHLQVLTSRAVAENEVPVLMVVCTDDGELQFLDGVSDFDPDDAVVECLHDALARDLTLVEAVRPLEGGLLAERDAVGDPWQVVEW